MQAKSVNRRAKLNPDRRPKLPLLLACTTVALAWRDQGSRTKPRDLLATEGFDTLDLKEDKALLDALAS